MTSFRVLLIYREKQNHVKFRYLKTNKQQNPHKQVSLPCRFHSCCYSCSQSTLIKASPPTLGSCCRCLLLPVLVRFFFSFFKCILKSIADHQECTRNGLLYKLYYNYGKCWKYILYVSCMLGLLQAEKTHIEGDFYASYAPDEDCITSLDY